MPTPLSQYSPSESRRAWFCLIPLDPIFTIYFACSMCQSGRFSRRWVQAPPAFKVPQLEPPFYVVLYRRKNRRLTMISGFLFATVPSVF